MLLIGSPGNRSTPYEIPTLSPGERVSRRAGTGEGLGVAGLILQAGNEASQARLTGNIFL